VPEDPLVPELPDGPLSTILVKEPSGATD
jgi:hypothetical protein